jgi:molybdenum cofactor cytidylyltransferase
LDLQRAFSIHPGETVALTGAGGKTGLMFALAKAVPGPVLLTTTTHLGAWQAPLAEKRLILTPGEDLIPKIPKQFDTLLVTGPTGRDDRLAALTPQQLEALRQYAGQRNFALLIEADGARQKSLKAPAEHEPAAPAWAMKMIVVAGLSALGRPLSAATVHRPERFAALSDLELGETVTSAGLAKVLRDPQGGLKGLPSSAERVLFLNQAGTPELLSQANWIAGAVEDVFHQVVIGSLRQEEPSGAISSVHSRVAGVILAAGGSQRLGRPKQLLGWQGQTFIAKVVQNALEAGLTPLIVVTGAKSEAVRSALAGMPVKIVPNPDWQAGQSTSLKAGLAALPLDCQALMFLMSDQPQCSPALIRAVLETYFTHRLPIAAPRIAGRRANPVLFGREAFDALRTVQGDQGGRAVFDQFQAAWLDWVDERNALDVDDEAGYARLQRAYFPDSECGTGFHNFLSDSVE